MTAGAEGEPFRMMLPELTVCSLHPAVIIDSLFAVLNHLFS